MFRAALLLLVLPALYKAELQMVQTTVEERERARAGGVVDPAMHIEWLMTQIDDVLPPHGYVGYLDPHHSWTNAKSTHQFYLTQYALVPRVVVNNTIPSRVIYFSHREEPLTDDMIPSGMRVVLHVRPDLAVLARGE